MPIVEIGRQRARLRIAPTVGELGLQNTSGTGTHENADPRPTVTAHRRPDLVSKAIAFQPQHGESVVAAVIVLQRRRQALGIDTSHLAHPGRQGHGLEVARLQTAALGTQTSAQCGQTGAQTGGGSEGGQQQGSHSESTGNGEDKATPWT